MTERSKGVLSYEVDGLAPSAVVDAHTVDDVSNALSDAQRDGHAVIPWGGGTRIHVGNVPGRYDVALDMTGLSSGIEHVPGDMTVVVDAGVTVAKLQAALATAEQRLPFDVQQADRATIGGSVASNALGWTRLPAGGLRDWIIGMKVAGPDGTVTKSGGRVVKNVQGFDLHRLHTGAFGSLGIIVEIGFKLIPVPMSSRSAVAWSDSIDNVIQIAAVAFGSAAPPEALVVLTGRRAAAVLANISSASEHSEGSAAVLARSTGSPRSVERQVQELTGAAGSAAADGYEVLDGSDADGAWRLLDELPEAGGMSARINVRTARVGGLLTTLEKGASAHNEITLACIVDAAHGVVQAEFASSNATGLGEMVTLVFEAARVAGGDAMMERCPLEVKQDTDVFGVSGPALDLMRSVKSRFDSGNTLNPGRFAGRM